MLTIIQNKEILVHHNNLFRNTILFRKYLSYLKSKRIVSVSKNCVWISVFMRKKHFENWSHGSQLSWWRRILEFFFKHPACYNIINPILSYPSQLAFLSNLLKSDHFQSYNSFHFKTQSLPSITAQARIEIFWSLS